MALLFLMYGEVTLHTKGHRRFVGVLVSFLGIRMRPFISAVFFIGMIGALLAFLILGGDFLFRFSLAIFGSPVFGNPTLTSLVFYSAAALLIFQGLRFISRFEIFVMGILLSLYALIITVSLFFFDSSYLFLATTPSFTDVVRPYGVILFALGGLAAVPEMRDILLRPKQLSRAIVTGMGIVVFLYALFTLSVVGATGPFTTADALGGLGSVVSPVFTSIGTFLGMLSCFSILTIVGVEVMDTWRFDFHRKKITAWGLTMGIPLMLFLLGVREFIAVAGFVGAVAGGLTGILIVLAYEKWKKSPVCLPPHACWKIPGILSWIVASVFVLGVAAEVLLAI
jgi:tyrosine-specific transport protein